MSADYTVPLFLRGRVITDHLVSFGTRSGAAQFQAPDMAKYVDQLPLRHPGEMADLYARLASEASTGAGPNASAGQDLPRRK